MKAKSREALWAITRIIPGVVLLYAGWSKLNEPAANFEAALLRYGVLSPQWIPWIARVLPWLEWFWGGFLVVGYLPRVAAIACSLLSLGFLVVLTSSHLFLQSGGSDCGCFGSAGLHLSIHQIFVVDLLNLMIGLRLVFSKRYPWSIHALLVKETGVKDDIS